METVPFGSQNVALPLALSSLKGEELPQKNDSYGSQRIYYTSGFHSFLPSQRQQMHRKGAQQACTVMLSFPLKQHVLCCKYSPQLVLITPSCWSDSVPFPIKAYSIVEQESVFFVLNLTLLLVRKQRFQFNPLPFYLLERADFHIAPYCIVYESVLTSRFISTVFFIRRRWFSCPAPWFRLSVCAGFHFKRYYLVYEEWAVSMLKRPLIFVKRC